ncbi:hypothetical protein ACS15_4309 [Ralstonia insidiosa]|uniref:Uncharacterized protein n=1 Tax=Ralstonia insidiosa TaxID=190721 RepID=A0AAC9BJ06_9RALS|nr:hypothetical protein ACS15_4309 [Ralstonia insidiosa]
MQRVGGVAPSGGAASSPLPGEFRALLPQEYPGAECQSGRNESLGDCSCFPAGAASITGREAIFGKPSPVTTLQCADFKRSVGEVKRTDHRCPCCGCLGMSGSADSLLFETAA